MKKIHLCAVLALSAVFSTFADLPEPYIWWKMDKVEGGKIKNSGTNTDSRCDLTLGSGVCRKSVYGVDNALYFDATADVATNSWASSWTPALTSRTVSFWICRDADDTKVDATNKTHYIFSALSRMNIMVSPGSTSMDVKLGANEKTAEQIAHSYVYGAADFSRDIWHHIVVVAEDTGRTCEEEGDYYGNPIYNIRSYQDGVLYKEVKDRVTEKGLAQEKEFTLGNAGENGVRTVPGAFSDVRIYDCAFSTADVAALWQLESRTHVSSVFGFYRMEKIEKTAADQPYIADACGSGVPLMLGTSNVLMSAAGVTGKALDFPDCIECHGQVVNKSAPIRDLSVSFWMRPGLGMDKLKTGNVENTSPNIFQFGGYLRCLFGSLEDPYNNICLADMASVTNSWAPVPYYNNGFFAKGYWSHFVFVAKAEQDGDGKWSVTPKIYCDGKLVITARKTTCPAFEESGCYPASSAFLLGNMNIGSARAMWGQMDDVAVFGRALTDAEVKRLYQGIPEVEAGADFSVVGETTRLAGKLSLNHGSDSDRASRQDSAVWSLVSAPAGASPTIVAPDDLNTVVRLPVAGTYVFRLTTTLDGLSDSDDVTVTRVADLPGDTPSLTVTAPATAAAGAVVPLVASVGDRTDVRVFWSKVSGPGAVGFEPKEGLETAAHFGAAGSYTLKAVADDGARTTAEEFSVTVASGESFDITSGLLGYWPLGSSKKDEVSGTGMESVYYNGIKTRPGVNGYGAEVVATNNNSLYTYVDLQETPLYPDATTDNLNTIPKDRWRSLSLWMKYNPNADTNNAYGTVLAEVRYTLGLFYDKVDGVDRITMYQQTMCNAVEALTNFDYYNLAVPSFDNRWVHVYAAFDRQTIYTSNISELWIDGVKQTVTTKGMGGGRIQSSNHLQFGNLNVLSGTAGANDRWNNRPRTFPGSLDEVRLYNRKLTEAEIRFLAANPVVDINYAPAADVTTVPAKLAKDQTGPVVAVTADDGQPTGSTLSGRWVVLDGDAANLVFTDPTAASTTVKALKAGTYTFAYAVTDGEKTTYSEYKVYTVEKPGMILLFK